MAIDTFNLLPKASISLALMAHPPTAVRRQAAAIRSAGFTAVEPASGDAPPLQRAAVIVETSDPEHVAEQVRDGDVHQLSDSLLNRPAFDAHLLIV